ncbi:MAG: PilZ domain-containing protein [Phycisphaerales bacterium]|nr:MAG: PilZ domain-containing protein [Phycisphaerales bacterium]
MTYSIGRLDDQSGQARGRPRATGRVQQEQLACNLGPITDFSRGGLRVITERELQGEHDVTLPLDDGDLTVRARVIWSRCEGKRRYLIGMKLLDVDEETAERLARIAMTHARIYPLSS